MRDNTDATAVLQMQHGGLKALFETVAAESNALASKYDALGLQRDHAQVAHEKEVARLQLTIDISSAEHDVLRAERDAFRSQTNGQFADASAQKWIDALQTRNTTLLSERRTLQEEKRELEKQRDVAVKEQEAQIASVKSSLEGSDARIAQMTSGSSSLWRYMRLIIL